MIFKQMFRSSAAAILLSSACLGTMPLAASAIDFVPKQQGEINVGLGCLDTCIDVGSIFESIVSLDDDTTQTKSRLFVDYFGMDDVEQSFGQGANTVVLRTRDAGTNASGFWFRPSEVEPDGGNEEMGQLEVGTYRFNFARRLEELTIDFFDTESKNSTGVLAINGQAIATPDFVMKGEDGNIVSQTFTNVNSIELKLGLDRASGTGDGVDFRMSGIPSVPEPAMIVGLMAIAGLGLRRKQTGSADNA